MKETEVDAQVRLYIGIKTRNIFERKIVNIFLSISLNVCLGCS